jgi:branched-chain amino acid aminotransferase
LVNADEAFFSGTAVEITPITTLDSSDIGDGVRGSVTEMLQSKYSEIVYGKDANYADWLTHL